MAAKDPQPQSVSAGIITGSSAGLGDDKRTIGDADKYAVGMCRDVSDMLRIVISQHLVQLNTTVDIQQRYVDLVKSREYHPQKVLEPKNEKEELDEHERTFFTLIVYLREIFPSDEDFFDPESDQVKQVRKHLKEITLQVNRKGGQRRLFDEAMKPISSNSILTHQIAQKLSHALIHKLLMYQLDLEMSELIALAKHLNVFKDNQGASIFFNRFEQTWKRIKRHETHVEESTEDVTTYNNFKSFLLICCKEIFDEEMMKQFADYKTWMEEDKIVKEQRDHLKTYADILIKAGALPPGVTLAEIMQSVIGRGEAITPQILEELYLRVALCMRINDAYMIHPETIDYSILYSRWIGDEKGEDYSQDAEDLRDDITEMMKGTSKYKPASIKALKQALQDISHWVNKDMNVRGSFRYQKNALKVYKKLVTINENFQKHDTGQCAGQALQKVDNQLQRLREYKKYGIEKGLKRNSDMNIKWSPFYDRVLDEFSACLKAFQKDSHDLPDASYLLTLLTRLQVAVLDEVLVQLPEGLSYIVKNFWFSDDEMHFKQDIQKLLVVVNRRKHQLGFFCGAIADGKYLDSFNKLFDNFFTPTLAGLCSTNQMIGERTKRGAYWWE